MLTKKEEKLIRGLQRQKIRQEQAAFLAEGSKLVDDLLKSGMEPILLLCLESRAAHYIELLPPSFRHLRIVEEAQLQKLSTLQTANQLLAVFRQADPPSTDAPLPDDFLLYLDGIRDPGNMGTILRLADWFGMRQILGSGDCVDIYNPKVVQASMGSLARVSFRPVPAAMLQELAGGRPILGSDMEGADMYSYSPPRDENVILVIGNEARGIREEMQGLLKHKLRIPSYPTEPNGPRAESLNAAIAAAIFCAEFRRKSRH
jgi:TrmH family RNA methyltransferase